MNDTNIIIVDDSGDILSALKRELGEEHYDTLLAQSGDEALQILSNVPCKIIISDVKMPVMDGFELLEKVKSLYPDMIRVVLSGHTDVKLVLQIVNERGIDRYMTKPWNTLDLKSTINQCIELYDLRMEVTKLRERLHN
jgi:response regulator RpfG family c-di-GMP phosphodiesterase